MNDDLTAGPAAPLVLTALAESETHGYALIKRVRELAGGHLEWPDGMLYPLLRRLRRLGYVSDYWAAPSEGHRRRYYRLTPTGRRSDYLSSQQPTSVDASSNPDRMFFYRLTALWSPGCPLALAGSPQGWQR